MEGVANLLDRGYRFHDQDISISHRLPAPEGKISPIIVKFTRRNTRDHIFSLKRQLQGKSTVDLDFPTENRIYLSDSLTQRIRELLKEVKASRGKADKLLLMSNEGLTLETSAF